MNPIVERSESELADLVESGKARPDMIRKKHIYDAHKVACDARRDLLINKGRNNGLVSKHDLLRYRYSILMCWDMVGEMAFETKCFNYHEERTYPMDDIKLVNYLYTSKEMNEKVLHHLMNYINYVLHKLNITNLLMDNIPFDSDVNSY